MRAHVLAPRGVTAKQWVLAEQTRGRAAATTAASIAVSDSPEPSLAGSAATLEDDPSPGS